MPAGLVKTPSNGKAKESLQKSAERTTSNGKKFVQTRLPFKMITPSGAATSAAASSVEPTAVVNLDEDDPPPATREPRKRKLSYDDDETPPKEGTGCSNKEHGLLVEKENLNLSCATATKKVKTTTEEAAEDVEDQVIELNDDDDDDAEDKDKDRDDKAVVEAPPKKSKTAKDTKGKTTAKASKSAAAAAKEKPEAKAKEKASPAPIQIKWPLANKRPKRRKSLKKAEEGAAAGDASAKDASKVGSESSDDIEIIAEELNPQKKPKVQEPEKGKKKDQKEDQEAKEEKDEVMVVEVEDKQKKEKSQEAPQETKNEATLSPETTTGKKEKKATEKEANAEAEISILSSSEGHNSSSDHEMDVDTEAAERADAPPLRKSLPEATTVDAQKMLTPKQQRLLEQRRKAREEKEQKLAEERRLKQQEKELKEQQRKLEREEKEQQRKLEREEKEQQRKVEREEKERKRQAEVDSKNEEKRKRNEAKEEVQRKKDEERRKKELEREEAEQKKKRAAESFTKFFVPKQPKSNNGGGGGNGGGANGGASSSYYLEHEQSSCDSTKAASSQQQTLLAFRPFQIKDDMLLAPVTRASLRHEHRLQLDLLFRDEQQLEDGEDSEAEDISRRKPPGRGHLYLSELSSGRHKPLKALRDARLRKQAKEEEDDDVQVIGDDLATAGLPIEEEQPSKLVARMRAKYLHFADNRRPPYYGTWRKRSQTITARRPLAHDKVHFDYELDSDCEWEEEEPGESLSASEDEKEEERESEEESEEEYNEWYVPHGHLSDEELQNDGDGADDGHTREAQKAKLQVLQQEFAQEMKKQTKKIKPRLLGPIWLDENGNQLEQLPAIFAHTIGMYACWSSVPSISLEPPPEPEREDLAAELQLRPLQLDERLLQQLVRLTHGNRNSKTFLINEYLEYLKTQMAANRTLLPAKSVIREKIDELASWKTVELSSTPAEAKTKSQKKPKKRLCWMVASEMLHKFQLQELTLHNQWDYTLTPKFSETAGGAGAGGGAGGAEHEPSPPAADASPPATTTISSATATPPNTTPVGLGKSGTKKRATLLMSVPRDQPIPSAAKNALISQFLRRQTEAKEKEKEKEEELGTGEQKQQKPASVDEDVVLLSD